MRTIRLERGEWTFDEADQLGPAGGFGEVFRGEGDGTSVAIKRLKLSAGAASHREMSIGSALADREHAHVVPILDYGQDADSDRYYLVMPICEYSLQEVVDREGRLSLDRAKQAALDIIEGLSEVRDIVHRDLKPGNVLWHEARWKIADFGIAKFVEDATSLESLRSSLTPAYAAPEQWRGERPTPATDVYALGCIFHTILNGEPPFIGSVEDMREAHLHRAAPNLPGVGARLAGLVGTMLRKAPASRPSLERCRTVIQSVTEEEGSAGRAAVAAAGHAVSQQEAAAEAIRKEAETVARQRMELQAEGEAELDQIIDRLFSTIEESSESVRRDANSVTLGQAHLSVEKRIRTNIGRVELGAGGSFDHGWDVVTGGYLVLKAALGAASPMRRSGYTFSTTLAFATMPSDSEYRWRELAFMEVFSRKPMEEQPFSLNPFSRPFSVALSNVVGQHQLACGPWNIDAEDEDAFQERWLKLFAKAANGKLQPPNQLPLREDFFA